MSEAFIRMLRERLNELKEAIERAEKIIKLGKNMGLDVTKWEVELARLKERYERYKKALEEVYGGES